MAYVIFGMNLTNAEILKIEQEMLRLEDMELELPVWRCEPLLLKGKGELPLEHKAAAESFLVAELEGRARLSHETRLREERRLALRQKKRKRHGGASRGRRHWKRKEKTRQRALDRKYDEDAYKWFMWANKTPVDITREEWDRWLAPVFSEYPRGALVWKRPNNRRAYSVYNLVIEYRAVDRRYKKLPAVVVYDGQNSLMWDVQHPEHAERALYLAQKKKPPLWEAI